MKLIDAIDVCLAYDHTEPRRSLKPEEQRLKSEAWAVVLRRKQAILTERFPHLTLAGRLRKKRRAR